MSQDSISIVDIAGGALIERINLAMQDIIDNIDDVNTSDTATRELQLKIAIKPFPDRRNCTYTVQVRTKLQPVKEFAGHLIVGYKGDEPVVYENNPNQQEIKFQGNIIPASVEGGMK